MFIKKGNPDYLDQIAAVEAECFSPAEAASRERLAQRLEKYPEGFWLGFDDFRNLVCYAAGPAVDQKDLTDDLYADPSCHVKDGGWQMIFSVCTIPGQRGHGYGSWILNRAIRESRSLEKKGVVLTCKEEMIPFYEKFGFENEGLCDSQHGGARWYQMRLIFDEEYDLVHLFDISDDPEENRKMFEESFWGLGPQI